ncbi:outer membrane receptor for ferrienterochelin and colicin [Parabacteroides sp. PH5-13]|uniref:TonB-dependent receptor n=1 Tax=unclassified Parabacteroides TaxID=2649774 RepID=UPI00247392B7|nr:MULTISPECIES: TonB-dependent receptor [unclassified Parabacteroides]MDH6305242.1 outer membrane receptor for ferrienterochelin and colicin [Parabacteroides sp. PH5-39]MDH6320225.1 outer membrane receptor for ferrienterochelin and colicin [Parabacteroides sp. PH5-13]MDH6323832.1 outer membrane receptor for ferrienterochelin and colicin [Parabacteroides sp. PH5-8]MDH6384944.1 outer membrane receptor for ferrienterochelin and colicin [Parabacteroides sp. PH5-17]MDH6394422.1 outer membrane rece
MEKKRFIGLMILGVLLLQCIGNKLYAQEEISDSPITLDMKERPLKDVLKEIEQQAGIYFSYESALLQGLPKVSFTVKQEPLESCLKQLFLPLPILYQVNGRYIVLKRKPKQVIVSGFARDKASSESLIGASVYEKATRKGTATNNYGFFSIALNPGDIDLTVSYIGYKGKVISFKGLGNDTTLTVDLESSIALKEVVVVASGLESQPVQSPHMGKLEISQQTIRATPVMFGEADIIKTLQLTPGVSVGTEGFSGMYVRGGSVDENLFQIDGNPIYQVSHVGGIFSAFNSEAVRGMDFYKAGFPARYGGRLSSVVDIHTKEGNMKEFHGSATVGLISGNVSLEGPIVKDRTSFAVALRRTWLDVLTAPGFAIANSITKKNGEKNNARYAFHDLNVKLNHHFNDRSRMFVSLYNGNDILKGGNEWFNVGDEDAFKEKNDASLRWGNLMATAGWTYVFNNKLFGKLSGVYTQYRSSMKQSQRNTNNEKGTEDYEEYFKETSSVTGIMDAGLRTSFDYFPSSSHHIRFGGDLMMHRFRPEHSQTRSVFNDKSNNDEIGAVFANELLWAKELSAFAEDDWTLSKAFRANGGVRYSIFNIDSKTYMGLEPRLSLRWLINNDLSLKTSYARMYQYVHLVANSYMNLPTDAWMPVTKHLKPLISDQVSLGAYYNWNNSLGNFDLSIEGYYKKMDNLLEYRDGYTFLPSFSSWEEKMASGEGRAYGGEFMVQKQSGKLTGWVGYTLSWADRQFDDLNEGKRFPSKYDNRHKLNIVAMYKVSPKVELSAAWSYASGNRATLSLENYQGIVPTSYYQDSSKERYYSYEELDYYGERNNYQLPAYHRLDLGINIYRPKKSGRMGIWNISIYNVYSRMNPFMIYKSDKKVPNPNYTAPSGPNSGYIDPYNYVPCFKTIGIMPIIPSVSYTYKF